TGLRNYAAVYPYVFVGAASCRDKVCGCRFLSRLEAVPTKKWPRIYNLWY
ncbi:MAG: hypothetical protein GX433_10225, partial [Deltaproteobacteria bacterium]|nr:hypothetical protein [Deltaproteobacteria bacterium]